MFLYLRGCVAKLGVRALGHQSKGVQPLPSHFSDLIIKDIVNIININGLSPNIIGFYKGTNYVHLASWCS